jgi:phage-related minor tail protein
MEDLENDYKELKKKNKALRHHLKEEAAANEKHKEDILDYKSQLAVKQEKVEELMSDNQRLTKRI